MILAASVVCLWVLQTVPQAPAEDAALVRAVERFYETQQSEDVAGYLALWGPNAQQRPTADQLKFIFDSGDDKFSGIQITRAIESRGRMRVRVEALRERTLRPRSDGVAPPVFTTKIRAALLFEKQGDEWKLLREGQPGDDLAAELVEVTTDEERDALLAGEPDLIGPPLLSALARLGGNASVMQNYPRALSIYQQLVAVARRGGFKKEEGEGLQNVANALYFLRRFPEALTAYEQRLAIERERDDQAGIAAALGGIATIRYSYAEYTEALARYREALAIQERLDDVAGIAFTSISIGNIAYLQGDFPAAIAAYRRSFDLNRTMAHADGESRALEGLGRVHLAQGDYAAALEAFDAVLNDKRMQQARGRLGSAAQNVGDVHFRLGNLEAAKAKYEESRAHYESTKDMSNVGRVIQGIALTELVAGRFPAAEENYKRSGSICAAADDNGCSAAATAGIAYTQSAQERYWEAAGSYRKAIGEFEALARPEEAARSEVGLSQALAGAEDFAGAIAAAGRGRDTAIGLGNDDVLWRALTAEARAIRKIGDRPRALGVARAAVVVLDRLEAAALDKPATALTTEAAAALATVAVLQAESGDALGAFATSERLRALEVRSGLATNEREISRGMSDDERAEERALAAQLNTSLAQISREKSLPKPDAARIASLEKAAAETRQARRAAMQRLFERHPDLRVWRGLAPPRPAIDAARVLLDAGELILSFVLDDDDLLVLTVARQQGESGVHPALAVDADIMHVKRRQVNASVQALQQAAAANDSASWRKAVEDLAGVIPPAARARLASASRIMVLPHDVLWRVPIEALPSGDRLIGDHASVSVAGSLDSLIRSGRRPAASAVTRMVGIGPPALTAERTARFKQVAPGWSLRMPESAELELENAAGSYDASMVAVLSKTSATESAVREQLRASVLHFAAPFRINAASPLFSSILLDTAPPPSSAESATAPPGSAAQAAPPASTPRPDQANDGALELREVMNLDLNARIAVFSDGAATSMRDGASAADVVEWGWLAAGVPSLLIARWAAPPAAGARLLAEFHKQVRAGAAPAVALRAAQLLIRSTAETSAPIHWAGWMLLGAR